MDAIGTLVQGARVLATVKCVMISAIALTLYDYFLTFDDEVRYVWRGRKTWVSYLYIVNRVLLTGYQFWGVYYTSSPRNSETLCIAGYYIQVVLISFFLLSSDIFVTLRVYAITSKNKIFAVYFGIMVLARTALALALSFRKPPAVTPLPPLPIDAFSLCAVVVDLRLMLIPSSIGTAFELSAFLVILWYAYRNKGTLRVSALVRTIATEATVYFLAIVAVQTYVQLSLTLMEGINQQLSFLAYGLLNPILTMRFALSLRRSADLGGGREWPSTHFANLASGPSRVSAVYENIEMNPVDPPDDQSRTCES